MLAQTVDNLPYSGRLDFGINFGAFVFGSADRSVLALWSATEANRGIALPAGHKVVIDMFGKQTTSTQPLSLTIGRSPVYVGVDGTPEALAAAMGKTLMRQSFVEPVDPPDSLFNVTTDPPDTYP